MGFVKQAIVASAFGATAETDLISLSQGFIVNAEYILVQSLVTALISIYIRKKAENKEESKRFISNTIKVFMTVSVILSIAMMLGAHLIARVLAPTYSAEQLIRLAGYIRLFSPALIVYIIMAIFRALLNANQRFIPGQLVGLNQSIIIIVLVWGLGRKLGVQTLVISFFVYLIWNVLYLAVQSRSYWKLCMGNPFYDESVFELLKMMGPLLLGYAMTFINQQVDKVLVSGMEGGTVTAMSYAATLSDFVATFTGTFCSILFTHITIKISDKNQQGAAKLTIRAAEVLITLLLPISILTVLCAEDIVTIAFGRGAFSNAAVRNAGFALTGYGLSFVPQVLRNLFSRFQYGYQDSKLPMINSMIGICFNIGFSILLCPYWGVFGVTFASSVSVLICGVLNMISAPKHNEYLTYQKLLRKIPVWAFAGLACGVIAKWGLTQWGSCSALVRFILTAGCGFIVYFLITGYSLFRSLRSTEST